MLLTAVVLLSAVLGLAYLYLQKCWSFWKGQGLPQIDPKSILGSMPFFITKSCPLDEGLIQACFFARFTPKTSFGAIIPSHSGGLSLLIFA